MFHIRCFFTPTSLSWRPCRKSSPAPLARVHLRIRIRLPADPLLTFPCLLSPLTLILCLTTLLLLVLWLASTCTTLSRQQMFSTFLGLFKSCTKPSSSSLDDRAHGHSHRDSVRSDFTAETKVDVVGATAARTPEDEVYKRCIFCTVTAEKGFGVVYEVRPCVPERASLHCFVSVAERDDARTCACDTTGRELCGV